MSALRVYLQGERVGLGQTISPSSYIHWYEIVLEGFKFSFFKWNSWLFLNGRIPCLQFTVGETKKLRTTKKWGVLFNTEQIFPFRFTFFKFYTRDSIHTVFFWKIMKIFMEVHATHPTFLSLIFHSSPQFAVVISVKREKNWNHSSAFNNAPTLDISSDRDTNPGQLLLQTLSTANSETQHFPLQECPYGHPFLSGVCDTYPKVQLPLGNHFYLP